MNKIFKLRKIIIAILLLIMLINTIGKSVKAVTQEIIDSSKKASLTIVKYEHANGSTENIPLKGVEFTIYSVPEDKQTAEGAESYIQENNIEGISKITETSGIVKFSNLDLGRYLVVETKAPKNVMTKMESFLIDLPRSNDDGKWNYDVTVYPKNITIYGKVVLTHNNEKGEPLKDATWKLQKLDAKNEWKEYEGVEILTTDENGQIVIENLEKGEYRLVQNSISEGYILDSSNTTNFIIDENNINKTLNATSEKLEIKHYVKLSDGNYGEKLGAYTTDVISWKTTSDVASIISKMDKYTITETLQEGLIFNENTLKVYGDNELLNINTDYNVQIKNQNIKIDFIKGKLQNYKKVTITYDTNFDYDNVKHGKYETKSKLEYTDNIDINGKSKGTFENLEQKAIVYTGTVLIYKTNIEGIPLEGAKFKIATSRENAENGIFIKDKLGNDLESISDSNGYVLFNGLKLGKDNQSYEEALSSYWIVEVQAPSYEENGETKYYNLLSNPVEVQVNSTSGIYSEENTTHVINKKGLKLPLTGGVFNVIPIVIGTIIVCIAIVIKKKEKKNEKDIKEK